MKLSNTPKTADFFSKSHRPSQIGVISQAEVSSGYCDERDNEQCRSRTQLCRGHPPYMLKFPPCEDPRMGETCKFSPSRCSLKNAKMPFCGTNCSSAHLTRRKSVEKQGRYPSVKLSNTPETADFFSKSHRPSQIGVLARQMYLAAYVTSATTNCAGLGRSYVRRGPRSGHPPYMLKFPLARTHGWEKLVSFRHLDATSKTQKCLFAVPTAHQLCCLFAVFLAAV